MQRGMRGDDADAEGEHAVIGMLKGYDQLQNLVLDEVREEYSGEWRACQVRHRGAEASDGRLYQTDGRRGSSAWWFSAGRRSCLSPRPRATKVSELPRAPRSGLMSIPSRRNRQPVRARRVDAKTSHAHLYRPSDPSNDHGVLLSALPLPPRAGHYSITFFLRTRSTSRSIAQSTATSTSSQIVVGAWRGVPPAYTPVRSRHDDQPCAMAPAMSDSGLSPIMYLRGSGSWENARRKRSASMPGRLQRFTHTLIALRSSVSPRDCSRCAWSIASAKAYVLVCGLPYCVYKRSLPVVAWRRGSQRVFCAGEVL